MGLIECSRATCDERGSPSYFFHQIPLVPRPFFRSTSLTESLERAIDRLVVKITLIYWWVVEYLGRGKFTFIDWAFRWKEGKQPLVIKITFIDWSIGGKDYRY